MSRRGYSMIKKFVKAVALFISMSSGAKLSENDGNTLEDIVLTRCLCLGSLADLDWSRIRTKPDLTNLRISNTDETQKKALRFVQKYYMNFNHCDVTKLPRIFKIIKNYSLQDSHLELCIRRFCENCTVKECSNIFSFDSCAHWFFCEQLITRCLAVVSSTENDKIIKVIDCTICMYIKVLDSVRSLCYEHPTNSSFAASSIHKCYGIEITVDLEKDKTLNDVRDKASKYCVLKTKADAMSVPLMTINTFFDEHFDPESFPYDLLDKCKDYLYDALRTDMHFDNDSIGATKLKLGGRARMTQLNQLPHLVFGVKCNDLPDNLKALQSKASLHGTWWKTAFDDSARRKFSATCLTPFATVELRNGWRLNLDPIYGTDSCLNIRLGLLKTGDKMLDDALLLMHNGIMDLLLSTEIRSRLNTATTETSENTSSRQQLDDIATQRNHDFTSTNLSEHELANKIPSCLISCRRGKIEDTDNKIMQIVIDLEDAVAKLKDKEVNIIGVRFRIVNEYNTEDYELAKR